MTDQRSPVTPPPGLIDQLKNDALHGSRGQYDYESRLVMAGYVAGANQELEACCEWFSVCCPSYARELRNARRPEPKSAADCLAARPLMEQVAAMANCIGRHTVDEIIDVSDQAASWLAANPPGVSSCVEPQPPASGEVEELVGRLKELAHATTEENWREFDMRVPAEPLRDADLVLTRAADLLQRLASDNAGLTAAADSLWADNVSLLDN